MQITSTQIVLETYLSDITSPGKDPEVIHAIRKVHKTADYKYFIERPKGYFMLQEVDVRDVAEMRTAYNEYMADNPNKYKKDEIK